MKKIIFIIIIITLFVSCETKIDGDNKSSTTKYKLNILDSLVIKTEALSVCCNDSLIFIAEKFGNNIVCYDYEGKEKFSFGGEGSGPGEFTNCPKIIAIWQDHVVAPDTRQYELELFNLDGTCNKTVSYIKQMISPVSNIATYGKSLIIEGLSLNMKGNTALLHKVISINNSFNINEESVTELRRLTSLQDIFKNHNPFQNKNSYFSLGNSTAKIITDDVLRIYRDLDSIEISLQSIPLVKIDKEIINYYENNASTKEMEKQGIKIDYSFPKYLPKIKSVFKLNNNIIILSQEQYLNNEIDKLENRIYVYDDTEKRFASTSIPDDILVSKIISIYKSRIFLNYEDKIKIVRCKIESNY